MLEPRERSLFGFRLGDIPISFSFFYLLMMAYFVMSYGETGFYWGLLLSVSVIAHELGHAFVARHYRLRPQVVISGWGGYCSHQPAARPRHEVFILLAGPGAGLALAALCWGLGHLGLEVFVANPGRTLLYLNLALSILVKVNLFWSLLNLIPLWPLDGGQLLRIGLLHVLSPERALVATHGLGLMLSAIACAYGILWDAPIIAVFAFLMAWQNLIRFRAADTLPKSAAPTRAKNKFAVELLEEARKMLAEGDAKEAARLCHQLRAEPGVDRKTTLGAWEILALATAAQGEHEEALRYAARAPDSPPALEARLRSLLALGRIDEAREAMTASKVFRRLSAETRGAFEAELRC